MQVIVTEILRERQREKSVAVLPVYEEQTNLV